MPRKLRVDIGGYIYHLTARGNNKEQIFYRKDDYEIYLDSIKRAKERIPFTLFTYVLMPNHIHLLLEPQKDGDIGRIMQIVQTRYAVHFNLRHQRCGHTFQGRFHSVLVEEEPHLLELSRYIHLNPLRAGLVQNCIDYPYSSYKVYLKGNGNNLINIEEILSHFGKRRATQISRFRKFVEEDRKRNIYNPFLHVKENVFLGSDEFKNKIVNSHLRSP
ncbi:MAG: transposase [Actinomycetota bacterium]